MKSLLYLIAYIIYVFFLISLNIYEFSQFLLLPNDTFTSFLGPFLFRFFMNLGMEMLGQVYSTHKSLKLRNFFNLLDNSSLGFYCHPLFIDIFMALFELHHEIVWTVDNIFDCSCSNCTFLHIFRAILPSIVFFRPMYYSSKCANIP